MARRRAMADLHRNTLGEREVQVRPPGPTFASVEDMHRSALEYALEYALEHHLGRHLSFHP